MINSSELFMNGELNLVEAKRRIFENIISQRPGDLHGRFLGFLFCHSVDLHNKKNAFYIPEYKLKVSGLDGEEQNLEIEVVEVPDEKWKIVSLDTPAFSRGSKAEFRIINGELYLCFIYDAQILEKDLNIKKGQALLTAIRIDIVNRTFECINYDGKIAPVDLLDAYQKMGVDGYFQPNHWNIRQQISLERKKNKDFDKACNACCLSDILNHRDVKDSLFLLNAYMVKPTEMSCLYNDTYGRTVLSGFIQACFVDGLHLQGEVMSAFNQLIGQGDTVEEILGATMDELSELGRSQPRTSGEKTLHWVRFIQKKKGLPIHQRSF